MPVSNAMKYQITKQLEKAGLTIEDIGHSFDNVEYDNLDVVKDSLRRYWSKQFKKEYEEWHTK